MASQQLRKSSKSLDRTSIPKNLAHDQYYGFKESHDAEKRAEDKFTLNEPITIGSMLEKLAIDKPDLPITPSDAAAIRSAEARAKGGPGSKGGIGSIAHSAANKNVQTGAVKRTLQGWAVVPGMEAETFGTVLKDAKSHLEKDKIITRTDAEAIEKAEKRASQVGHVEKDGVSSHVQEAVIENVLSGAISFDGVKESKASVAKSSAHVLADVTSPKKAHRRGLSITIGDVLEEVAHDLGDKPVTPGDAAAISSAESRVIQSPGKGQSLGSRAQSAAARNVQSGCVKETQQGWEVQSKTKAETIGSVLKDVKKQLKEDKEVADSDAIAIENAERRNVPGFHTMEEGIAAHARAAVARNAAAISVEKY